MHVQNQKHHCTDLIRECFTNTKVAIVCDLYKLSIHYFISFFLGGVNTYVSILYRLQLFLIGRSDPLRVVAVYLNEAGYVVGQICQGHAGLGANDADGTANHAAHASLYESEYMLNP